MTDRPVSNAILITNPEKPCRCCAKAIPQAATFCVHCENHQGWFRRNISFGETTLALLVALAAVLTGAIPAATAFFQAPDSRLHQISTLIADGAIKVAMANPGDRAGVFQLARVVFRIGEDGPGALVNFIVPGNPILGAGEARAFTLKPGGPISRDGEPRDIVLAMQELDFLNGVQAKKDGTAPTPLQCDVVFETTSFSGKAEIERIPNRCLTAWLSLFPADRQLFQDTQKELEAKLAAGTLPSPDTPTTGGP